MTKKQDTMLAILLCFVLWSCIAIGIEFFLKKLLDVDSHEHTETFYYFVNNVYIWSFIGFIFHNFVIFVFLPWLSKDDNPN